MPEPIRFFEDELRGLLAVGFPPRLLPALRQRRYPAAYRRRLTIDLLLALGGGVATLLLLIILPTSVDAAVGDLRRAASWYDSSFHGWTLFPGGIGLCLVLQVPLMRWSRRRDPQLWEYGALLQLARLSRSHGLEGAITFRLYQRAIPTEGFPDVTGILTALDDAAARWFLRLGCALLAVLLYLPWDLAAYTRISEAGLEEHTLSHSDLTPWSELRGVEIGCMERDNGLTLRYHLDFGGEAMYGVWQDSTREERIEDILELDRFVRTLAVPVVRAECGNIWSQERCWTEGCPAALAAETGLDAAEAAHLVSTSPR